MTDNTDGSITLDIRSVALDFGDDGHISSYLTVMPQPDGSFHYVGNLYSDWNIENKVSSALELAHSADILYQGGLATVGDSIEQGGYRYAEIDKDAMYEQINLGGVSSVEGLTGWYDIIFEKSLADRYVREILAVPLYIDVEEDGETVLYVNQDVTSEPIAAGTWSMEDFTVTENTPHSITVQLRYTTPEGATVRELTLAAPEGGRRFLLTESYEED
jgi:hypothetical protein